MSLDFVPAKPTGFLAQLHAERKARLGRIEAAAFIEPIEVTLPNAEPEPIVPPTIPEILQAIPSEGPKCIRDIQKLVCYVWGVSLTDLLSARRTWELTEPRQVAYALCKFLTKRSFPEIGRLFGDRDHATILHGARKYQWLVKALEIELQVNDPTIVWVDLAFKMVRKIP